MHITTAFKKENEIIEKSRKDILDIRIAMYNDDVECMSAKVDLFNSIDGDDHKRFFIKKIPALEHQNDKLLMLTDKVNIGISHHIASTKRRAPPAASDNSNSASAPMDQEVQPKNAALEKFMEQIFSKVDKLAKDVHRLDQQQQHQKPKETGSVSMRQSRSKQRADDRTKVSSKNSSPSTQGRKNQTNTGPRNKSSSQKTQSQQRSDSGGRGRANQTHNKPPRKPKKN
jgi:hypothetical protein